jgi:hypothetical protein
MFGAIGDGTNDDSAPLLAMANCWNTSAIPYNVNFQSKFYLYGTNIPMVFSNRLENFQFYGPEIAYGGIYATNYASKNPVLAINSDFTYVHDFSLFGPNTTSNTIVGFQNTVGMQVGNYNTTYYAIQDPLISHVRIYNFATNFIGTHWTQGKITYCNFIGANKVDAYIVGDESTLEFTTLGEGTNHYGLYYGPKAMMPWSIVTNTIGVYSEGGIRFEVNNCDMNCLGQLVFAKGVTFMSVYKINNEGGYGTLPSLYFTNCSFVQIAHNEISGYFGGLGTAGKPYSLVESPSTCYTYLAYNASQEAFTNYFNTPTMGPPTVVGSDIFVGMSGLAGNVYNLHASGSQANMIFQNVYSGISPNTDLLEIGVDNGAVTYPTIYTYNSMLQFKSGSGWKFQNNSYQQALFLDASGNGTFGGAISASKLTTTATNLITFSTASLVTNTLGYDGTAIMSAGTAVTVKTPTGTSVGSAIATPLGTIPLRAGWYLSGTSMSGTIY